jgi:hypothetical protein
LTVVVELDSRDVVTGVRRRVPLDWILVENTKNRCHLNSSLPVAGALASPNTPQVNRSSSGIVLRIPRSRPIVSTDALIEGVDAVRSAR